jgi:hypothetical protein
MPNQRQPAQCNASCQTRSFPQRTQLHLKALKTVQNMRSFQQVNACMNCYICYICHIPRTFLALPPPAPSPPALTGVTCSKRSTSRQLITQSTALQTCAAEHQLAQRGSTHVVVAGASAGADAPGKLRCLPLHLPGHLPQSSGHPDTLAGRALQT